MPAPDPTPAASTPVLEVRDLWKVFGARDDRRSQRRADGLAGTAEGRLPAAELKARTGCTAAVRDVSFAVQPGEVFVVMGLSGSGKSTLVRLLTRLIEPSAGSVSIDGESVTEASPARLRELRRRRVAMVFQQFGLLPHRPVLENVAFGLELRGELRAGRRERAAELVELVGLGGFEKAFPDQLSGGMQQRVGLARALAGDPGLLLLDEPFSALDPLTRRDMQAEVKRLHREVGTTMVFVTHDLPEAVKLGHRILIMRQGAVVQVGTPAEIVADPADDYVRDFVSDVPRSHVLTLRHLARAPRDGEALDGPVLGPDVVVRDAVRAVLGSHVPVRVADGERLLGLVDDDDVLRVVVAEEHP